MLISLDLLAFQKQLKLRKSSDGKTQVWDPIRKKYLLLQPEELVRQLLLLYLLEEKAYNKNRIRVEKGLQVNTLYKRCDILVHDAALHPLMLIECKAANIPISQEVFDQVARYNLPLQVQYLVVSNGLMTYCCEMNYQTNSYTFLDALPNL